MQYVIVVVVVVAVTGVLHNTLLPTHHLSPGNSPLPLLLLPGDSPLTRDEYVLVADQYGKGRDACRAVFESFTAAQQACNHRLSRPAVTV